MRARGGEAARRATAGASARQKKRAGAALRVRCGGARTDAPPASGGLCCVRGPPSSALAAPNSASGALGLGQKKLPACVRPGVACALEGPRAARPRLQPAARAALTRQARGGGGRVCVGSWLLLARARQPQCRFQKAPRTRRREPPGARLQKVHNPTVTACAAAPRSLQTLAVRRLIGPPAAASLKP